MLIALDTTGPFCSAAIYDPARQALMASRSDDLGRGHAEHLMPMLNKLLNSVGLQWKQFSAVACATGPGSFTGLRVGLATARGLALALNCPCIGVTVFEAYRAAFAKEADDAFPMAVVQDARRGMIWMQVFDREGSSVTDAVEAAPEDACARIAPLAQHLVGSGAPILQALERDLIVVSETASPPIAAVAEVAAKRMESGGSVAPPEPLYLRSPDAKPQAQSAMTLTA